MSPISFDPFLGWVDTTDPDNLPPDVRVISASDLLRYENFGVAAAAKINELEELRGTGSPQGVVTAVPGTYYTDTAGTRGAWRWLKTSGTGNTGWIVQFGDTGIRNVAALFPEIMNSSGGNTPLIYLRRIGTTVYLSGARMGLNAGTTVTAQEVPLGFRPPLAVNVVTPLDLDTTSEWLGRVIARDGTSQGFKLRFENLAYREWMTFNVTYNTPDAWPATLPGIAA